MLKISICSPIMGLFCSKMDTIDLDAIALVILWRRTIWLDNAHMKLHSAVGDAYSISSPDTLIYEEMLEGLLRLNQERGRRDY